MDNITQGITGLAVAKLCLCNTKADKYWWRFVITFFCLANFSDIDIILRFWSYDIYFEQHRGYTHSLLGLLTIVPLGMWVIKKVYQDKVEFTLKQLFITSFSVMFFGHNNHWLNHYSKFRKYAKRYIAMESYSSMVGRYRNNCNGNYINANNECWRYATF